jgi:hypothetical protein
MLKSKEKKSINFLDPVITSKDVLGNAYIWLFNIGKYLLLLVEVIVLGVFFARFVLDKKNNDFTESINDKVVLLSNEAWTQNAARFENLQKLLTDITKVREGQELKSSTVSEILSGIPSALHVESFSLSSNRVSLHIVSGSLETIENYEFSLKQNINYSDVTFNIAKKAETYEVRVSFKVNSD